MQLTRQGVRNLNGPKLDGHNHNGRRDVTCPHYRNPHHPTVRERRIKYLDNQYGETVEQLTDVYLCTACGEERFTGEER